MLTIVILFLCAVGTESWSKYDSWDCDNDGEIDCRKWDYAGAKCSQPLLSPDHIHAKIVCVKGASFGILGKLTFFFCIACAFFLLAENERSVRDSQRL